MSSLVGWVSASFCQCQQLLLLSVSVSTSTLLSWTKWSANKQNLHLKSVAGISHHSALSEDSIPQCGTSCGSRHKDKDQCKLLFPSTCTTVGHA